MLARAWTFALDGPDPAQVSVEVDIRAGLPGFSIVGLADAAVREARQRVRSAIQNSGFEFPGRRITANLAPAHLRKEGPGFDLALACGVLAASEQLDGDSLAQWALYGELSLSGELRNCRGTLAVAEAARRAGLGGLAVAASGAAEAALVGGLRVAGLASLTEAVELLRSGRSRRPPPATPLADVSDRGPDLAEVHGHALAIRALTIAAAGSHNLLMCGPPGTGKTMLARRLPSILPPLTRAEAMEVTRIHGIASPDRCGGLITRRPFRCPHHTISAAGLVGGGPSRSPGEASLAHNGVLFLDELSEFSRHSLEALRQPLEDGRVAIVRGQRTAVYPTRFMLVAATNPCPCGYAGFDQRCRCTEADLARHRRRLSGPLLDRLDLVVHVARPSLESLSAPALTTSARERARVLAAREHKAARIARRDDRDRPAATMRSGLGPGELEPRARAALANAYRRGALSARGHERVLGVARTIADLRGVSVVALDDVLQALALRQDDALAGAGAA